MMPYFALPINSDVAGYYICALHRDYWLSTQFKATTCANLVLAAGWPLGTYATWDYNYTVAPGAPFWFSGSMWGCGILDPCYRQTITYEFAVVGTVHFGVPDNNPPVATATPQPTATLTVSPSPSATPLADAYCAEYLFRDDTPIVEVLSELVASFEGECVAIIPELQVDLPFDIGSLDIDAYYVCPTYWTVASITMFGISFGVNWLFVIPLIFIYRQFMKL